MTWIKKPMKFSTLGRALETHPNWTANCKDNQHISQSYYRKQVFLSFVWFSLWINTPEVWHILIDCITLWWNRIGNICCNISLMQVSAICFTHPCQVTTFPSIQLYKLPLILRDCSSCIKLHTHHTRTITCTAITNIPNYIRCVSVHIIFCLHILQSALMVWR